MQNRSLNKNKGCPISGGTLQLRVTLTSFLATFRLEGARIRPIDRQTHPFFLKKFPDDSETNRVS